jgi:antitoxin MazE
MRVTINGWGDDLGLRIPLALASDARLADGSVVDVRVEDGRLIVEQLDDLQSLLDRLRLDNIHDEAFPASSVGRETL